MKTCLILLAALATGCSSSVGGLSGDPTTPEYSDSFIKQHDGWCKSHFCMFEATVYTAIDDRMYEFLSNGLARFRVATERTDLVTDVQSGIPVIWREHLMGTDADTGEPMEMCAMTDSIGYLPGRMYTQRISVDPTPPDGCPSSETSLLHELIHALAPEAEHVDSAKALFYYKTGSSDIDYSSLAVL